MHRLLVTGSVNWHWEAASFQTACLLRWGVGREEVLTSVSVPVDFLAGEVGRATVFFNTSYAKLYSAFEDHRYGILNRINQAHIALTALGKHNTAMGVPEEIAALYNQLLDHLFSYGIDVSLSGLSRDFTINGFLFADSPKAAQELVQKLKYTSAESVNYNSPSS